MTYSLMMLVIGIWWYFKDKTNVFVAALLVVASMAMLAVFGITPELPNGKKMQTVEQMREQKAAEEANAKLAKDRLDKRNKERVARGEKPITPSKYRVRPTPQSQNEESDYERADRILNPEKYKTE